MTSPARAGSTLLAAKPTAVARNALPKRASRRAARAGTASAARGSPGCTNIVDQRQRQPLGPRVRRCRAATRQQIDVAQEQRDQRGGHRQHDDGPEVRSHGVSVLYYNALRRRSARRYMLLLSARRAPCKMPALPPHEESCCRSPRPFSRPRSPTAARSPGQGPRHLRLRRSPADRRHRSHLGVRLRARLGHSRQGQGPDADLGVLVRADARRSSPNHIVSIDAGDYPAEAAARARDCCAAARCSSRGPSRCRSSASRAATCRLGLEGLRSRPARSAASRCRRACANRTACPQPIFTPATKAQSGHDINISEAEAAELVGHARARRACAT